LVREVLFQKDFALPFLADVNQKNPLDASKNTHRQTRGKRGQTRDFERLSLMYVHVHVHVCLWPTWQVEDFVHYAELESGWNSAEDTAGLPDPAVLLLEGSDKVAKASKRGKAKGGMVDYEHMEVSEGPRLGMPIAKAGKERVGRSRQPLVRLNERMVINLFSNQHPVPSSLSPSPSPAFYLCLSPRISLPFSALSKNRHSRKQSVDTTKNENNNHDTRNSD